MSFNADEEILQDFLVEVGELLEQLSAQLVGLETRGDDYELLNAIFRGFHTVKGGAGFLQLDPLVDLCHVAENVFDLLRNKKINVSSELVDIVLQALDSVNAMFKSVHEREYPQPANPKLIASLNALLIPPAKKTAAASVPEPEKQKTAQPAQSAPAAADKKDFSDQDFEALLVALDAETKQGAPSSQKAIADDDDDGFEMFGEAAPAAPKPKAAMPQSLDDEFESLLDQMHGKGKGPSVFTSPSQASSIQAQETAEKANLQKIMDSPKKDISDDEFEMLLDELHGKGKSIKVDASNVNASAASHPSAARAQAKPNTDDSVAKFLSEMESSAVIQAPRVERARPAKSNERDEDDESRAQPAQGAQKDAAAQETTVRVDTKRLDDIMNMVGELVLVRNRLVRLGLKSVDESMAKAVANLDVVTADLQTAVMKTRMQPIKKVFGRFPRVVRDLARNLKKEINLELKGEETDLDKNLVEALADPLVHLVRNAVDHGIEMPEVREKTGKSRVGKVTLAAQQEGDHIVLSISDDGGGMDPEMLRRKAVEKGIMDQEVADRLSETEAFNLIFHPGFSTKDQVSEISGRGVGMDVVKTKITQLNGTIDVTSVKGGGTIIAIKVPLTLAIMPTLMVMIGKQTFALPLVSVNEIFHIDLTKTNVVDGQEVVVVRERALPLFHLKRWLVQEDWSLPQKKTGHVVVVSVGTQKVGFVVDQLIGQEEVVIKPLGKMLHGTAGMAGATITGDGRIALILDVPSMLKRYAGRG